VRREPNVLFRLAPSAPASCARSADATRAQNGCYSPAFGVFGYDSPRTHATFRGARTSFFARAGSRYSSMAASGIATSVVRSQQRLGRTSVTGDRNSQPIWSAIAGHCRSSKDWAGRSSSSGSARLRPMLARRRKGSRRFCYGRRKPARVYHSCLPAPAVLPNGHGFHRWKWLCHGGGA